MKAKDILAVLGAMPRRAALIHCPFFSASGACTPTKTERIKERRSALPSTTPAHDQACRSLNFSFLTERTPRRAKEKKKEKKMTPRRAALQQD